MAMFTPVFLSPPTNTAKVPPGGTLRKVSISKVTSLSLCVSIHPILSRWYQSLPFFGAAGDLIKIGSRSTPVYLSASKLSLSTFLLAVISSFLPRREPETHIPDPSPHFSFCWNPHSSPFLSSSPQPSSTNSKPVPTSHVSQDHRLWGR